MGHAGDAARDGVARPGHGGSSSRALQITGGDFAEVAQDAAGALAARIQEQPLAALLVAAVIGYIVGRIGRYV